MHSRIPRPCLSYRLPAFPRTCLCPLRSLSYCSATAQAIAQPLLMDAKTTPRHAPCREFLLWNLFVKYANLRKRDGCYLYKFSSVMKKYAYILLTSLIIFQTAVAVLSRAQHPLQPGTQDRYIIMNNIETPPSPQFPSSGRLFQDFQIRQ